METKTYEVAKNTLKQLMDREGINYITAEPYMTYEELLKTEGIDGRTARTVLIALLAGASQKYGEGREKLTAYIQRECCLKKSVADSLGDMFIDLFSEKNLKAWKDKNGSGLRKFCEQEWEFEFDTNATWHYGSGSIEASYHAEAELAVCDSEVVTKVLKEKLDKNPFLTDEDIYDFFEEKLQKELDFDFEEYVTAEKYYEPVAEDYEFEYFLKEFCKKYGLEIISCEGDGSTSDYEPDTYW